MKVPQAINYFFDYHRANSKKNTVRSHEFALSKFKSTFGDRDLTSITTDEILSFMSHLTEGKKQRAKHNNIVFPNFTPEFLTESRGLHMVA